MRQRRFFPIALSALLFVLAVGSACGGDSGNGNSGGGGDDDSDGATAEATPTTPAFAVSRLSGSSASTGKVELAALTGAATGTAEVRKASVGTEIAITMQGLPEGPHVVELRANSCEGGSKIGPLGPLEADAGGGAEGVLQLTGIGVQQLFGQFLLVYEGGAAGELGAVLSCGQVEAAE